METREHCAYNTSRQCFLCLKLTVADIQLHALRVMEVIVGEMDFDASSGLWLTPLEGAPMIPRLLPFDLIYLDKDQKVICAVEMRPEVDFPPWSAAVVSALVLAPHTISSTQTRAEDLLSVYAVQGSAAQPARSSVSAAPQSSQTASAAVSKSDSRSQIPVSFGLDFTATKYQGWQMSTSTSAAPVAQAVHPRQEPPSTLSVSDVDASTLTRLIDREEQHLARAKFSDSSTSVLVAPAIAPPPVPQRDSLKSRFLHWLTADDRQSERRIAPRRSLPGLIAFDGTPAESEPLEVADISSTGVYLRTEQRWPTGRVISLTLQKKDAPRSHSDRQVAVEADTVRWGEDGIGLSFVLPPEVEFHIWDGPGPISASELEADHFLRELRLAKALGVLRHISSPATEEVSRSLHEKFSNQRVASAVTIAITAQEYLSRESESAHLVAHPDLVQRLLEHGSWADSEPIQTLWAGLLASSCTVDGQDQSNLVFIELLDKLTPIHLRIFNAVCAKMSAFGAGAPKSLYCAAEELIEMSGTHNLLKIQQTIAHLSTSGLFAESAKSSYASPDDETKTTPTALGLQMYARCHGRREPA